MAGRHRTRQSPRWQLLAAVAVLVVIVLAVVGGVVAANHNNGNANGTSKLAQTQPTASATTTPSPDPSPTLAQAHTISATPTPSDSASTHAPTHGAAHPSSSTAGVQPTLTITWTQRAWVRVTDVNAAVVVLSGSHEPGYAAHWDGARYYVEVGNSGGVRVSTNGGTPYTLGPRGQIRRFTIARS